MSENIKSSRSKGLRALFCTALAGALIAGIALNSTAASSQGEPVSVPEFSYGLRIDSSTTHAVAVKDGSVYGWGTNWQDQLPGVEEHQSAGPVKLSVNNVVDAAASQNRTLTVSENGELRVYGLEPTDSVGVPQNGRVIASDAAMVDASDSAAAYISKTGALYTWGRNYEGQLGVGNDQDSSVPLQVFASGVRKVRLGESFMVALMDDGTVYGWGSNQYFQLGGNIASSKKPVRVATGMVDIDTGRSHLCLLSADGTLSTCGANMYNQIGTADGELKRGIAPVLSDIASVSAGGRHTFAIAKDGLVYSWGSNVSGQLGDGSTTPQILPSATAFDFTQVFASGDSTYAVRSDGKIASFGDNTNYLLGKTDGSDSLRPLVFLDADMNWIYAEENPSAGPASFSEYLREVEGIGGETEDPESQDSSADPEDETGDDQPAGTHVISGPVPADTPAQEGESSGVTTVATPFVSGLGDGSFAPGRNVTRAEFLRMVVSALADYDDAQDYGDAGFTDVPENAWYANCVAYAKQIGLVSGLGDGTFGPGDAITRADASVIVSKALGLDTEAAVPSKFSDVPTGRYFSKHIDALTAQGILSGYGDGSFQPFSNISRAEAVTIVAQAAGYRPDKEAAAAVKADFTQSPFSDVAVSSWYYPYVVRAVGYVK